MSLVALVGNPNVGKSTLFNGLTGLKQHTGNWPGKTVALATGEYAYKGKSYRLVDLPGTYSLKGASPEEGITEEFLKEGEAQAVLVVCDGCALERSLILALQVLAVCPKVLIAVNLLDEAERQGITVDTEALSRLLGVPVVGVCGKEKQGLNVLQEKLRLLIEGYLPCRNLLPQGSLEEGEEWAIAYAEEVAGKVCTAPLQKKANLTERLDRVLLHPLWAYPILLTLVLFVLFLTIEGANYPSQGLQWCFTAMGKGLRQGLRGLPPWLFGLLIEGIYEPVTRVVAVMLPPMSIFFPLFTLLEDFGYLPRIAYLLDEPFRRCGTCGKQSLTMCMGLGCNAVGVTGCRIIDSPGERLIAILTNSLVPCNGRFPSLILFMGLCFGGLSTAMQTVGLTMLVMLSVLVTMGISRFLRRTLMKGEESVFLMELPQYRRPKVLQVLIRSFLDRCLSILGRAVAVAAPMGVLIWLMGQISIGNQNLLGYMAQVLEKPGAFLGMGGTFLLAFLLGSPANELVIPIALMILTGGAWGESLGGTTGEILVAYGISSPQVLCAMVFMLFHWPCTTTLWTIYKETRSPWWTALAWLLPTVVGATLCAWIALL